MIGVVLVSHSDLLARGVAELLEQVTQGKVRIATAGGTSDPAKPIGTDAFKVLEAIESVYSDDGVLVFMDLGSAILSAETALEMLDDVHKQNVHLSKTSIIEGAMAAVSIAAAGGSIAECLRQPESANSRTGQERLAVLSNPHGLHARPAARLIRIAREAKSPVFIENVTAGGVPANASSLHAILALTARQGHQLRLRSDDEQILDKLAEFIESGCGDVNHEPQPSPAQGGDDELAGIAASSGIALGPVKRLHSSETPLTPRIVEDPEKEWRKLQAAIAAAQEDTKALYQWTLHHAGEDAAGIFDAQELFLDDPALVESAGRRVQDGKQDCASAWQQSAAEFISQIELLDDEYLKVRAADLRDAAARVLRRITGGFDTRIQVDEPSILAAQDLMPSEVEQLDPAKILAVCLETGSASSHAAILLRARRIPAVVGLGPALAAIPEGTQVGIDGHRGALILNPKPEALKAQQQPEYGKEPAITKDGHRITILSNISRDAEVFDALDSGAEGVGVLRTEFLFLNRKTPPSEDEQFEAYNTIAEALGDRPLVIRTLDIGGDKSVPYLDIGPESNPFLGWRGIRISLDRPDLLQSQLRAICRAAKGHNVEVLLPMITTLSELRRVKSVLPEPIKVGVMIEVPAAAAIAHQLAPEASRLSIGTNDLVQYFMAADRTNSRVAPLADHFQPAVLRAIRDVAKAGHNAGIPVDVCGEMAADPLATPILLGLGIREFSVSASLIPGLKRAISKWTIPDSESLAAKALEAESSEAVRLLF